MFKYCRLLITAMTVVGSCVPLAAQQAGGTKVGVLTCKTSASLGLLVGSHQKLRCNFKPDGGGEPEGYVGHVTWEPMLLSAGRIVQSRCNRSRSKGRLASTLLWVLPGSHFNPFRSV